VVAAVLATVTPRTRLAVVDHVTSSTGLVLPIEHLVAELEGRSVQTLVDGAHGPGMVSLALRSLGASYYAGNCHKWLCAPKGAAFLWVRRDRQPEVRPTVISHGANSVRTDRSRFGLEFDWPGTADPTAVLALPAALALMASLRPGGWPEVMARNRALALKARAALCEALDVAPPAPDSMIGALAALPLPDATQRPRSPIFEDALQTALLARHGIEVPVFHFPEWPRRLLRISAQAYNTFGQFQYLGAALRAEL
jgi:isopenicillin-N epimerase